jgi:hypothetical protein
VDLIAAHAAGSGTGPAVQRNPGNEAFRASSRPGLATVEHELAEIENLQAQLEQRRAVLLHQQAVFRRGTAGSAERGPLDPTATPARPPEVVTPAQASPLPSEERERERARAFALALVRKIYIAFTRPVLTTWQHIVCCWVELVMGLYISTCAKCKHLEHSPLWD